MRERSYNKGNKCETCGVKTVNGFFHCKKHRVITEEMKMAYREGQLKRVSEGRHNTYKASRHYWTLHHWVVSHLGKPKKCEHCGADNLGGHKIHWANKSRKYFRELNDWIRLCAPCHGKYDARNNNPFRGLRPVPNSRL